jgi:hypothetical protein
MSKQKKVDYVFLLSLISVSVASIFLSFLISLLLLRVFSHFGILKYDWFSGISWKYVLAAWITVSLMAMFYDTFLVYRRMKLS